MGAVVALGSFPFVVFGPCFRVGTVILIAGQEVGFHVAGVVGSVVPEGTYFRLVLGLPVLVHFVNHLPYLVGFGCLGKCRSR